jgi:hypothetical protein
MTTRERSENPWPPIENAFEQGRWWDSNLRPRRFLNASILGAVVAAIGIATLLVGNPVALFAGVASSLVDQSSLQSGSDQPMPIMQFAVDVQGKADAETLPPTSAADAPTLGKIAAVSESDPRPSEADNHDALFRQFQAWLAEEQAKVKVRPVQDASAQAAQQVAVQDEERTVVRSRQKSLRSSRNARAEIRSRHPRKRIQREQDARAQALPEQNSQVPDQPVQHDQAFPFLPIFGPHN